jgi:hypothetical protein
MQMEVHPPVSRGVNICCTVPLHVQTLFKLDMYIVALKQKCPSCNLETPLTGPLTRTSKTLCEYEIDERGRHKKDFEVST